MAGGTIRLTMAQAVIAFLKEQWSERDGVERPFFAACFGIFGHGNVAGIGQALQQYPDFRFYQPRNEQAMVHTAAAFARQKNRLQTLACTSSQASSSTAAAAIWLVALTLNGCRVLSISATSAASASSQPTRSAASPILLTVRRIPRCGNRSRHRRMLASGPE